MSSEQEILTNHIFMEYLKKCFPHNNMQSCVIRLGSICSFWIQTIQSSQQRSILPGSDAFCCQWCCRIDGNGFNIWSLTSVVFYQWNFNKGPGAFSHLSSCASPALVLALCFVCLSEDRRLCAQLGRTFHSQFSVLCYFLSFSFLAGSDSGCEMAATPTVNVDVQEKVCVNTVLGLKSRMRC